VAAEITHQNPDGTAASPLSFGLVKPGQSSAVVQRLIKNTGDVPLSDVRVQLEQSVATTDGELHGSVGATVLAIGSYTIVAVSLAPGASVTLDLYFSTPLGATPKSSITTTYRTQADY
jgi:hypothetical protein